MIKTTAKTISGMRYYRTWEQGVQVISDTDAYAARRRHVQLKNSLPDSWDYYLGLRQQGEKRALREATECQAWHNQQEQQRIDSERDYDGPPEHDVLGRL